MILTGRTFSSLHLPFRMTSDQLHDPSRENCPLAWSILMAWPTYSYRNCFGGLLAGGQKKRNDDHFGLTNTSPAESGLCLYSSLCFASLNQYGCLMLQESLGLKHSDFLQDFAHWGNTIDWIHFTCFLPFWWNCTYTSNQRKSMSHQITWICHGTFFESKKKWNEKWLECKPATDLGEDNLHLIKN